MPESEPTSNEDFIVPSEVVDTDAVEGLADTTAEEVGAGEATWVAAAFYSTAAFARGAVQKFKGK